jgi:hypothetical protein
MSAVPLFRDSSFKLFLTALTFIMLHEEHKTIFSLRPREEVIGGWWKLHN